MSQTSQLSSDDGFNNNAEEREFLSQHHMLGHTNGFDEHFMTQRGKKTAL